MVRGVSTNSVEPEDEEDPDIKEDLDTFKEWLSQQAKSKAGTVEPKPAKPSESSTAACPARAPQSCSSCSKDPCNLAEYIKGMCGGYECVRL